MDRDYELKYLALEDTHWWHVSRRDMILRMVAGLPRGARILDVGCSGGAMMAALAGQGFTDVTGVDVNAGAVELCGGRGVGRALVMDAQDLQFADGAFDLVIASDILEHVPDPERALGAWRRVLKSNGRLIIFVPGNRFLWSGHDVINHHRKRYAMRELVAELRAAGFYVDRSSGWNLALLLPAAVMAVFRRKAEDVSDGRTAGLLHATPPPLERFLTFLLCAENRFLQRFNVPAGISFFAVAHKPDKDQ